MTKEVCLINNLEKWIFLWFHILHFLQIEFFNYSNKLCNFNISFNNSDKLQVSNIKGMDSDQYIRLNSPCVRVWKFWTIKPLTHINFEAYWFSIFWISDETQNHLFRIWCCEKPSCSISIVKEVHFLEISTKFFWHVRYKRFKQGTNCSPGILLKIEGVITVLKRAYAVKISPT